MCSCLAKIISSPPQHEEQALPISKCCPEGRLGAVVVVLRCGVTSCCELRRRLTALLSNEYIVVRNGFRRRRGSQYLSRKQRPDEALMEAEGLRCMDLGIEEKKWL